MIVSSEIIVKPFETFVRVVIGDTIPEAIKYWSENIEPKGDLDLNQYLDVNGLTLRIKDNGKYHYGIILSINSPYSTIVHELFHLMMYVADHKGASWSEESDEWYAYCLSDLWEQVALLYDEYKSQQKEK